MTKGERKLRQQAKQQLVAAGVLPPPKKRINRKKYIEQAWEEYSAQDTGKYYDVYAYLLKAISMMATHHNRDNLNPSSEAIGAVKVLKVAAALRAFEEGVAAHGESTYKIADVMDAVRPIMYE